MTTRFPDEIIDPRVGQLFKFGGVAVKFGTKAISAIPAETKSAPHIVTLTASGLVKRIVNTTVN